MQYANVNVFTTGCNSNNSRISMPTRHDCFSTGDSTSQVLQISFLALQCPTTLCRTVRGQHQLKASQTGRVSNTVALVLQQ